MSSALVFPRARTLGELLCERAERASGRSWDFCLPYAQGELPSGFEPTGDDRALAFRYGDLLDWSRRAALALARRGIEPGDRVLLIAPTGPAFFWSFFGCQLLGAIPVPLVPPWSLDHLRAHTERIARVAETCSAKIAITDPSFLRLISAAGALERSALAALGMASGAELLGVAELWTAAPATDAAAPALLQFTSGSTSEPKGVVVPHAAVHDNCRFIGRALNLGPDDVSCTWLPLFHDMGLVGHVLAPLYLGIAGVVMPPDVFARQPRVWLEVVTRYRATISTAPNFAYDLCANKLTERDLERLELRAWRVAMCGGEPILPSTLYRFAERFGRVGFRASSFRPVYGLAEATLAVTIPPARETPRVDLVEREALVQEGRARPPDRALGDKADTTVGIVGVGRTDLGTRLRIVGPSGEELGEREVGTIEVSGGSLMHGYFRDPTATEAALAEGWLRTGDLGYLAGGELFVVGRSKEVILKGGRNLYPYDVEAAASGVEGVRAGRVAAFGTLNPDTGTDDVVLVCETRVGGKAERAALTRAIIAAVFAATAVRPDALHLVEPGTLTKTSSGKIQRGLVRERFLGGRLEPERASFFQRLRASLAFIAR